MNRKPKHRQILSACFAVSLLLHVMAVIFLQRSSLWFASPAPQENNWLSLVEKNKRDEILKVAFEPQSSQEETPSQTPQKETLPTLAMRTPVQPSDPEYPLLFQNGVSFPTHDFLSSPSVLSFSLPSESLNLLEYLPKNLIVPVPTKPNLLFPLKTASQITLSTALPDIEKETPPLAATPFEPVVLPLSETPHAPKATPAIPIPHLSKLPTLAELDTSSYSESFDTDLVFLPKEDGTGYLFALTLIPRQDLELPRIPQQITFLIDRSNSIQQGRLSATKSAIHKALEQLHPEDTFNIIAFDNKMEKMSPNPLPCVKRSYAVAEEFLDKIQLGSFFSSSEIHKPLFLTVPGQTQHDEIHTAILLTDGETLNKKASQRALLHDWTQYNRGKVSLYAVSLNSDPHAATLDAATVFNKGKMFHAPTNRGLKRKLLKLMKSIHNPIGKNISCKAINRSPQGKVQLFPKSTQTPHLYLDQPYVLLGETETLDDFVLFVQGRLKGRWLNIKKSISFLNARKGNKSLKQELALQRAYLLYEQYANDENPQHIAEAKALLDPFDCEVAFR